MDIIPLTDVNRTAVDLFIRDEWGGPMVVSLGKLYDTSKLPGFIAVMDSRQMGAVLYRLENDECEIEVLYSVEQNRGAGTALLDKIVAMAKKMGLRRVFLITTNDNAHAIRFYQRYGFSLKAVHIGSLAAGRLLKPGIPATGIDGIPLEHEFEFEILI